MTTMTTAREVATRAVRRDCFRGDETIAVTAENHRPRAQGAVNRLPSGAQKEGMLLLCLHPDGSWLDEAPIGG